MAFVRWVFYNNEGVVKYIGTQSGAFRHLPSDEVAKALLLDNANTKCLEWREPDPDVEAAFSETDAEGNPRRVDVSVDVSGDEPKLIFTYTPIENVAADDPYAIIDILTGGTE